MYSSADSLFVHGVYVFPVHDDPNYLQSRFDQSLQQQQPEIAGIVGAKVGGGFCAHGHASSFHNRFARKHAVQVYSLLRTQFAHNWKDKHIEIVPDRQCFRPKHLAPTAETWHRDLTPLKGTHSLVGADPDDLILGGWINCNNEQSQYLYCIPGSHNEMGGSSGAGFALIPKTEHAALKARSVKIEIPPGHGMVFNQSLIHCVYSTKLEFDLRRQYIAFRISSSPKNVPLIPDIQNILIQGKVPPLKSGQMPRMFPKLWMVNWPDKLIALSSQFPDYMKTPTHISSKRLREHEDLPEEGEHKILRTVAPDVKPAMPYSQAELALYLPHPCK